MSVGTITALTGSVSVRGEDGTIRELQAGATIDQNDSIITGGGSTVEIKFADESTMSLSENAELVIDELVYNPADPSTGSQAISLLKGALVFASGAIAQANYENVTLVTPVATIGIRGTILAISADDGADNVTLLEGKIIVTSNATGEQLTLTRVGETLFIDEAGQFVDTRTLNFDEIQQLYGSGIVPQSIQDEVDSSADETLERSSNGKLITEGGNSLILDPALLPEDYDEATFVEGQKLVLNFSLDDVQVLRIGNDILFIFEDGGQLRLRGLAAVIENNPESIGTLPGDSFPLITLLTNPNNPSDLVPVSGPNNEPNDPVSSSAPPAPTLPPPSPDPAPFVPSDPTPFTPPSPAPPPVVEEPNTPAPPDDPVDDPVVPPIDDPVRPKIVLTTEIRTVEAIGTAIIDVDTTTNVSREIDTDNNEEIITTITTTEIVTTIPITTTTTTVEVTTTILPDGTTEVSRSEPIIESTIREEISVSESTRTDVTTEQPEIVVNNEVLTTVTRGDSTTETTATTNTTRVIDTDNNREVVTETTVFTDVTETPVTTTTEITPIFTITYSDGTIEVERGETTSTSVESEETSTVNRVEVEQTIELPNVSISTIIDTDVADGESTTAVDEAATTNRVIDTDNNQEIVTTTTVFTTTVAFDRTTTITETEVRTITYSDGTVETELGIPAISSSVEPIESVNTRTEITSNTELPTILVTTEINVQVTDSDSVTTTTSETETNRVIDQENNQEIVTTTTEFVDTTSFDRTTTTTTIEVRTLTYSDGTVEVERGVPDISDEIETITSTANRTETSSITELPEIVVTSEIDVVITETDPVTTTTSDTETNRIIDQDNNQEIITDTTTFTDTTNFDRITTTTTTPITTITFSDGTVKVERGDPTVGVETETITSETERVETNETIELPTIVDTVETETTVIDSTPSTVTTSEDEVNRVIDLDNNQEIVTTTTTFTDTTSFDRTTTVTETPVRTITFSDGTIKIERGTTDEDVFVETFTDVQTRTVENQVFESPTTTVAIETVVTITDGDSTTSTTSEVIETRENDTETNQEIVTTTTTFTDTTSFDRTTTTTNTEITTITYSDGTVEVERGTPVSSDSIETISSQATRVEIETSNEDADLAITQEVVITVTEGITTTTSEDDVTVSRENDLDNNQEIVTTTTETTFTDTTPITTTTTTTEIRTFTFSNGAINIERGVPSVAADTVDRVEVREETSTISVTSTEQPTITTETEVVVVDTEADSTVEVNEQIVAVRTIDTDNNREIIDTTTTTTTTTTTPVTTTTTTTVVTTLTYSDGTVEVERGDPIVNSVTNDRIETDVVVDTVQTFEEPTITVVSSVTVIVVDGDPSVETNEEVESIRTIDTDNNREVIDTTTTTTTTTTTPVTTTTTLVRVTTITYSDGTVEIEESDPVSIDEPSTRIDVVEQEEVVQTIEFPTISVVQEVDINVTEGDPTVSSEESIDVNRTVDTDNNQELVDTTVTTVTTTTTPVTTITTTTDVTTLTYSDGTIEVERGTPEAESNTVPRVDIITEEITTQTIEFPSITVTEEITVEVTTGEPDVDVDVSTVTNTTIDSVNRKEIVDTETTTVTTSTTARTTATSVVIVSTIVYFDNTVEIERSDPTVTTSTVDEVDVTTEVLTNQQILDPTITSNTVTSEATTTTGPTLIDTDTNEEDRTVDNDNGTVTRITEETVTQTFESTSTLTTTDVTTITYTYPSGVVETEVNDPVVSSVTDVSLSTTVDTTINDSNTSPIATDDNLITAEDTAITFTLDDLLNNDSDADNDNLEVVFVGNPAIGRLEDNGDGSYTFTPARDSDEDVSITYIISDGEFTRQAVVNIEVTPVADGPNLTVGASLSSITFVDDADNSGGSGGSDSGSGGGHGGGHGGDPGSGGHGGDPGSGGSNADLTLENGTDSFTTTLTGSNAGFKNSYGFYVKDVDGNPVTGLIIWDNVKKSIGDSFTVDGVDEDNIGFFIIPNGDKLKGVKDETEVTFQLNEDGFYEILIDGKVLNVKDGGGRVIFDNPELHQGENQLVDNAEPGNQNWDDQLSNNDDDDFNDVSVQVDFTSNDPIVDEYIYDVDITNELRDTDTSEVLSGTVIASSVDEGVSFNQGRELADGTWEFGTDDLVNLQMKIAGEGSDRVTINFTGTATETDGSSRSTSFSLTVQSPGEGDSIGTDGNDVLSNTEGQDLFGLEGDDTFTIRDVAGELIVDGGPGEDTLNIDELLSVENGEWNLTIGNQTFNQDSDVEEVATAIEESNVEANFDFGEGYQITSMSVNGIDVVNTDV